MIRFILFLILFYAIYYAAKKILHALFSPPKSEVKGEPKKKMRTFDPGDIEDIDYKEVNRKDE